MPKTVVKSCEHCGVNYNVLKKKEKTRKYCSSSCAYASRVVHEKFAICNECSTHFDKRGNYKQKYCSKECAGRGYSKNYRHSDDVRAKLSTLKKGTIPWNKGLTSIDDSRILAGDTSPAFGKTLRTSQTHPEWAKKISEANKGKINIGDSNAMKRMDVRQKMSATRKTLLANPDERRKISESVRKAWRDGKFDGVRVGQCQWFTHTKPDGSVIKLQGTWELVFAKWMDENMIQYSTHKGRIPYLDKNGDKRSYYPDFFVDTWQSWVDVKNDYHFSLQEEKFQQIRKSNPNIQLLILRKVDLETLGVKFEHKYVNKEKECE